MAIVEKLMKIQTELKAPKNLYNKFGGFSYRNAEGILEAIKPLLKKYKCALVLEDHIENLGDRFYIKAVATLHDTEVEEEISSVAFARESESKKGMDSSQITGTASSYARKYALNGLFILDDTKDPDTDEYCTQTATTEIERATAAYPPRSEMEKALISKYGEDHADEIKAFSDAKVMAYFNKAAQHEQRTRQKR